MAITKLSTGFQDMIDWNKAYTKVTKQAMGLMGATEKAYNSTYDFGAWFELTDRAEKYLVEVANSGSAEATIKVLGGTNEIFGGTDLVLTIPASATITFVVETARYKQMKSEGALGDAYASGIVIVGESAHTVSVVKLP